MVQISKRLTIQKEVRLDETIELMNSLDTALAEHYCNNKDYEKGLELFREVILKLDGGDRNVAMNKYVNYSLQYAQQLKLDKKWVEAIEVYKSIMKCSGFPINVYKQIGLC